MTVAAAACVAISKGIKQFRHFRTFASQIQRCQTRLPITQSMIRAIDVRMKVPRFCDRRPPSTAPSARTPRTAWQGDSRRSQNEAESSPWPGKALRPATTSENHEGKAAKLTSDGMLSATPFLCSISSSVTLSSVSAWCAGVIPSEMEIQTLE